jgi:hypothetical protein
VKLSSKRRIVAVAVVVLLLLFLLRPGASRLKSRIAGSISAGLARPVEIGAVHIRLLPRPGFDLENLVVYDDPAFGAEPMLRAADVTADLRLTSLVRGRIEIARLDLTEPSLNLVQGAGGRWNLEALLERTAQTPLAPTAKAKSEPRPGFPYIEGSSGRINFKIGQEKKPYALTSADFAFWQDSENTWGVRLKAQPFRSDLNLSDTGTLRMNGTWQRAASLRDTPLQFTLEWDRPQLGQLTKFLTGIDKGWRGAVQLDATLSGTPAQLQISSDASIRDFRRYDILSGEAMQLAAHCDGRYSSIDHVVHELFCRQPIGGGAVTLHGDAGLPSTHKYDLVLMAEDVPAGALVALAQRAKKNIPEDLATTGDLDGSLLIRETGVSGGGLLVTGSGEISKLHLSSTSNKAELDLGNVPLVVGSGRAVVASHDRMGRVPRDFSLKGPHLEFGPFPVPVGRVPLPARAWVGVSGYRISLAGDVEVARAWRVARLFGLSALRTTAEGGALVDLQIAGSWADWASGVPSKFTEPQVKGTAKLHSVRVEVRGTAEPVEIAAADLQFLHDELRVTKLTASAAHTQWTGSLQLPRGCGTASACVVRFQLNAGEIGLTQTGQWINPHPKERPWYKVLSGTSQGGASFLASLRASGKVTAGRLLVRDLALTHVSANVNLDAGKLRISDLRGDFAGGKQQSEWQADFSVNPPSYSGSGTIKQISLRHLADSMKDPWIAGTADGSYQATASGTTAAEFWHSAKGKIRFDMQDGTLPHISLGGEAEHLRVERFEGRAILGDGKFEMEEGQLTCGDGVFRVSGSASLSRELDLKLSRSPMTDPAGTPGRGYTITGTVTRPRVAPLSSLETQAKLKR